jgi:hypothetical protein
VRFFGVYGLIIFLSASLLFVGTLNLLIVQVDAITFQICINNKCEMVSNYDGYQNKKECINEYCSQDLPTNASLKEIN